ncbi:hypothetical protein WMW72_31750 [Paenibacillus filicis]|uniref:Uncharacterized protein n=1 Tax=Paenibacillus filicis TaxID=669464 RepID=A0ABU9DWK1_9BACL
MIELTRSSHDWQPMLHTGKTSTVTILTHAPGLSLKGILATREGGLMIAAYAYNPNGTGLYDLVYLELDADGQLSSTWTEKEGILPELFYSPQGELWTSVVTVGGARELQIELPLHGRSGLDQPKGAREFAGTYVGTAAGNVWFHDVDPFGGKKPDKLLRLTFDRSGSRIASRKELKLPMPKNNKLTLDEEGTLQMVALQEESDGTLLLHHRQVDPATAAVLRERLIPFPDYDALEAAELSFEQPSTIIFSKGKTLNLALISPDGMVQTTELFVHSSDFYSLWKPVILEPGTFVLRFTVEDGNGWAVVRNRKLQALYMNTGEQGYTNRLTGEVLEIPMEGRLILPELCRISNVAYAIAVYPQGKQTNQLAAVLLHI